MAIFGYLQTCRLHPFSQPLARLCVWFLSVLKKGCSISWFHWHSLIILWARARSSPNVYVLMLVTNKFLLVIIKQQFVSCCLCHHHLSPKDQPSIILYWPVILTPIHLLILSGISYTERLRAQATALEQLTRLLLKDSFSFGDAEA